MKFIMAMRFDKWTAEAGTPVGRRVGFVAAVFFKRSPRLGLGGAFMSNGALLGRPHFNGAVVSYASYHEPIYYCTVPQMAPIPSPRVPVAFPELRPVRPKTGFAGGLRRRWKDSEGRIYEWDYQHGGVEMYDSHGRHLGQFDAETGKRQRNADPRRTIEP